MDYAASPCIIVGRTADHILQEAGIPALNVFLYANDDFRAQRVLERYGATDTDIFDRLREKDRARADYYEHFTGLRWGYAKNFHVCLDTSALGVDTCVDIIVDILREEDQRDY